MLAAGQHITPTLRLLRPLGAGGMGAVWVAEHLALQTQVVVKFMHAELAKDRESLSRFSREATAAANVKSPYVAQVLDHGVAESGEPYIVMELLEGCDLSQHLETQRVLSLDSVDLIVAQTCKALARAHEKGIVHRDIKPQNIFLCQVGGGEIFVKVLDFGIAKSSLTHAATSATKPGSTIGTPYYMSPEQTIGAKGVDYKTDLWALGVVVFECLTGRRPFEGETVGGLAVAICHGPIPVPTTVGSHLPMSLDGWFARACARRPEERFASAREMADVFHTVVSGRVSGNQLQFDATMPLAEPSTSKRSLPNPVTAMGATTNAPTAEEVAGVPKLRSNAIVAIAGLLFVLGVSLAGVAYFGRKEAVHAAPLTPSGDPSAKLDAPVLSLPTALAPVSASASNVLPQGVLPAITSAPQTKTSAAKPVASASAKVSPKASASGTPTAAPSHSANKYSID